MRKNLKTFGYKKITKLTKCHLKSYLVVNIDRIHIENEEETQNQPDGDSENDEKNHLYEDTKENLKEGENEGEDEGDKEKGENNVKENNSERKNKKNKKRKSAFIYIDEKPSSEGNCKELLIKECKEINDWFWISFLK